MSVEPEPKFQFWPHHPNVTGSGPNHPKLLRMRGRIPARKVLQYNRGREQGWIRGGQLPRAPRCKGAPRDEMYLFQIKYSFEKFRNSEAMQECNSILYSYLLR